MPIQPLWRHAPALFGSRAARGRLARRYAALLRRAADGAHLRDNALDFSCRDHGLVLSEVGLALVRDRLLEIGDDFAAVGIVLELLLRAREIQPQRLISSLVELVRVAIQVDADDFVHGYFPSCAMVALRPFQ
jgi:hypothetical protein